MQILIDSKDFAKLSHLQEAANAVCGTIEDKKTFTTYASELNRLIKYIDRGDITGKIRKEYDAIAAIYNELQKKRKHVDTTDLMVEINEIIKERSWKTLPITAWEKVKAVRQVGRPSALDYMNNIFDYFVEAHGDRGYRDDAAIVGGIAFLDGQPVTVIADVKGKDIGIKIVMLKEFSKDLGYILDKYKTGIFSNKEETAE